ncbi:unnamed protein product [Mytilus coruscus]|uniref:Uncharacterized protein n=1 Tax=Mytilus coruscus TaxID=42192 RepID=A0A6J8DU19_MYTCO|nr:unnamed protein product [Mytilus coruscus]
MTKLILQKVDAKIDQLDREQMPVQSTITCNTTLNSSNDETYTKRQIYTSTDTLSYSGTNPLVMNATHQPPKYHHHVSQPAQSQYQTRAPVELRKIKWSTVGVNLYKKIVSKSLAEISTEIQTGHEQTENMTQVNNVMKNAVIESAPRPKAHKRKKNEII